MTTLPTILRPWQPLIGRLDPDFSTGMADWLRRLDSLIEPAGQPAHAERGDPDGFDGLDRRGTLFRLRGSDWALADTLPLEFRRRLAMSELLYLRQSYREPRLSQRVLLLLDTGPDQLGIARLVHMALLFLFHHKVERRGAKLLWGSLQRSKLREPSTLDETEIRVLLDSRRLARPSSDDLNHILKKTAHDPQRDEVWMVGGPACSDLLRITPLAHYLQVSEVPEDQGRAIRVGLTRAGTITERTLSLPRPDDRLAARCLRNPFPKAGSPGAVDSNAIDAQPHPESTLALTDDGRHVLLRLSNGGIIGLHLPNSVKAPSVQPVVFTPDPDESVVAATWRSKRLWVATVTETGFLRTYAIGRKTDRRFVKVYGFEASQRFDPVPPHIMPALAMGATARHEIDVVLDGRGLPYAPSKDDQAKPTLKLVSDSPVAAMSGGAVALIQDDADDGRARVAIRSIANPFVEALTVSTSDALKPRRICVGTPNSTTFLNYRTLTGVETSAGELVLFEGTAQIDRITLPQGARWIGLLNVWIEERRLGFVILEADGRTLSFVSTHVHKQLLQTYAPITAAAANITSGHVAALTASGSLTVYSAGRHMVIFRHEFPRGKENAHASASA